MSHQQLLRWATIGFGTTLAGIITAFNLGLAHTISCYVHNDFPFSDKLAHFFLAGVFSLLVNLTLRASRVRVGSVHLLLGSLILLPLAALEEFSQIVMAHRIFSLQDLAANCIGIIAFGWIASARMKILSTRQTCDFRQCGVGLWDHGTK